MRARNGRLQSQPAAVVPKAVVRVRVTGAPGLAAVCPSRWLGCSTRTTASKHLFQDAIAEVQSRHWGTYVLRRCYSVFCHIIDVACHAHMRRIIFSVEQLQKEKWMGKTDPKSMPLRKALQAFTVTSAPSTGARSSARTVQPKSFEEYAVGAKTMPVIATKAARAQAAEQRPTTKKRKRGQEKAAAAKEPQKVKSKPKKRERTKRKRFLAHAAISSLPPQRSKPPTAPEPSSMQAAPEPSPMDE